jgi:hypothetical protein
MPYVNKMTTFELEDIKEQALIQINKSNVVNKINEKKAEIMNKINEYPIKQRIFLMNFFDIENTFNIDKMKERINSLNVNNILSDIQDLSQLPDNYNDFNTTENQEKIGELLLIMDYTELFCPICDLILLCIFAISSIYAVFLIPLFEEFGVFFTNCITLILFAPIYLPIAVYCGFLYGCNYDESFKSDIQDLIYHGHFTSAIIYVMLYSFTTGLWYGLEHVFFYILWLSAEINPNGWLITTGNTAPFAESFQIAIDQTTGNVLFGVFIGDDDIMRYEQESSYRDYLQIGFDWDNDMSADYWNNLCYDTIHPIEITIEKIFDTGVHTVNCFIRDNWGIYTTITFNFELNNDNENLQIPSNEDLPVNK